MFIPPSFRLGRVPSRLGTIAYVEADPEFWGPPPTAPLVFIHGFGGGSSSYEWSKVYPAFAAEYRVLAPDLPGWGASEHPERPLSSADYGEVLAEWLAQLCPEPAVVVASSLSAALAVRVAIAHPDRLRALVLVAPAGLADFGQDPRGTAINRVASVPGVDQLIYRGAIATAAGIRLFLSQRQFADAAKLAEETVAAYRASAQQPRAEVAALAFVRGDLSVDLAADLPRLTTPTAILWGEAAQITDVALGRRLAALNPGAIQWFETMPGVGLTPQLEQPGITIAWIQQILNHLAP
jgi:haloalkane dehalogenase